MRKLNFFKRRSGQNIDEYEETSEKKTSILGYALLMMLVIFLIIVGQSVFSDIQKIPEKPLPPTSIFYGFDINSDKENLKNIINLPEEPISEKTYKSNDECGLGQECESDETKEKNLPPAKPVIDISRPLVGEFQLKIPKFNEIDKKFGIDKKFESIKPLIESIVSLNKEINEIQKEVADKNGELKKLLAEYNISLQEVIAQEDSLMDKPQIKESIIRTNSEIIFKNKILVEKQAQRDQKITQAQPLLSDLRTTYKEAREYYKNKEAYYNLIVFLLKLLFVLPFFALSLRYYFKLHRKNSPNTIIATAILIASSILFLQIILIFLYQVLPMEWLKRIFKIFMEIAALKYVIYYISAILVIIIFGGIVYLIQKRVFDPKRVALRRLKDNKCPNCSFTIDKSYDFCPKCGNALKEKCPHCGNPRVKNLPFCPICGKK